MNAVCISRTPARASALELAASPARSILLGLLILR
jgi:hypothetical protein